MTLRYSISPAIFLLAVLNPAFAQQDAPLEIDAFKYTTTKSLLGKKAAVVSAHPLASKIGRMILKKGGNAIDAAIATQLVLAVVYPGAGNIGGGGFMVARLSSGKNITIDFREQAPSAARRDMYLDSNGNGKMDLSQNGHLAVGVPGTVAGIFAELKYAELPLKILIQPAIDLAEHGFALSASDADNLNAARRDFLKHSTRPPAFVIDKEWKAGDTLIQKDLAATLKRIRDKGRKGFYEGETARLIVEEMQRGKGIISYEDLKNYRARERTPMLFTYKGYEIITMPLPSSGGVLLPMMMKMVEDRPLKQYGFHSVKAIHLMTEVERLAYADRAKHLGDPDFYKVPVKMLISDAYIKERMKCYDSSKAGNSETLGSGVASTESEETTHISIYDEKGNAVSLTTTLNGQYGSRTIVGKAGFLLNNEMDDFSVKPGIPNMYGAIGGEANAILPGKRMLSSMTPVIVLRNGKPYIVAGTPGGTTIITSLFQTLVNMLEFDFNSYDAVNKPKFHHQWLPDELMVESSFPDHLQEKLSALGHKVIVRGSIGRMEVIKIFNDNTLEAAADTRGEDSAEGY
ncbi:MAG: gamma-glutamyltransferase [Chitinophagaceae bacterium]|nr:gamma-glutamyltransferase [Chitinophagaceae bacterium]